MLRFFIVTAVLLTTCIPTFADASILISEVAWMGTNENANAEWIELYNDGDSQDLSGWVLSATDGQPSIILSGIIGANTYALLERSDDTTVPNVTAFLIYTGALGNSGEILELRNNNNTLIDRVDGSGDWSIGGDNTTKETLQRQGEPAVGSWSTASPSPKGGVPEATEESQNEESTEEPQSIQSFGGNIIYGVPDEKEEKVHLEPALILSIGDDEQTVTRGVSTSFEAHAYKENGKEIVLQDIVWNFGDGAVLEGRKVQHTFVYVGDYIVSVTGRRTGFLEEISDEVHVIVHVVEPAVVIVDTNPNYIELENRSNEIVELSGFILVSGDSHFSIPENTFVLPKVRVCFPNVTTSISTHGNVHLFNPDGVLASTYGAIAPVSGAKKVGIQPQSVSTPKPEVVQEIKQEVDDETFTHRTIEELLPIANAFEANKQNQEEGVSLWWWVLGLITSIATASIAVLLFRQEQQEVIDGFIIETELDKSDV